MLYVRRCSRRRDPGCRALRPRSALASRRLHLQHHLLALCWAVNIIHIVQVAERRSIRKKVGCSKLLRRVRQSAEDLPAPWWLSTRADVQNVHSIDSHFTPACRVAANVATGAAHQQPRIAKLPNSATSMRR
jgi:hypothetical protein